MKVAQEYETMRSAEKSSEPRARPRLLYAFASTLIAIAHKAYQRVERLDGPVGSLARGADVVAGAFVRRMEQQWLSSLTFMDRVILIVVKVLTIVFPPLRPVVVKVDELAHFAGSFPDKFDRVVDDDIPKLIDRLRVAQLGTLLKNMANKVMNSCSSRVINMAEMDPGTVKGYRQHDQNISREEGVQDQEQEDERLCKQREDDMRQVEKNCQEIMEALEEMGMGGKKKGSTESTAQGGGHGKKGVDSGDVVDGGGGGGGEIKEIEIKKSGGGDHGVGGGGGEAKGGGGGNGVSNVMMRDPIIELFDEGWQLKPLKG